MAKPKTLYEKIGGQPVIDQLVASMYKHIGENKILKSIFPEDLSESARKQRLFLTQFFGGPRLYLEERGRTRLPEVHAPFEITPARRDAWLDCIHKALIENEVKEPLLSDIMKRLSVPANLLVNTVVQVENDE